MIEEGLKPFGVRESFVISNDELEERNLEMKSFRIERRPQEFFKEKVIKYLADEKRIKVVNVSFTDLEGKLLSLDYDKKHLLKNYYNLTFDGSSIRGFSDQEKSDLILDIDWSSFRWLNPDIFGPGKVILFANVLDHSRNQYPADFRGQLKIFADQAYNKHNYIFNLAPEIEGFLLDGIDAEQNFSDKNAFELVTKGGYFNSLPQDKLRLFIDMVAGAKRSMGFENEKDHPEVAPSQFELNYKYTDAVQACDQIQLYKLLCRQVAKKLGCTASFLPKPIANINGSGMHLNMSMSQNGENLFYDASSGLSAVGQKFADSVLCHAKDMCLIFNSSVNSYRRLDPKFEAPNEIKISNSDRSAMIRVPIANQSSARIEIRSVAPDCNPYLAAFGMLKIGMLGIESDGKANQKLSNKIAKLPCNIYDAIQCFNKSSMMLDIMGKLSHNKYSCLKEIIANRSPKDLGAIVKKEEIIYHHEVTNQYLWYNF
ncbi:MAG: glutamine synthetase family protein [Alphaproteobacteria bacterium]|nr:glutamine synthetase family protein [Alphaproteobacteria bacterium]